MKKIGFLIGYFPLVIGGAELQSRYFCDAIKDRYEIFYISISPTHLKNEEIIENGVKIYIIKAKKTLNSYQYLLFHKNDIIKILEKENPNFIYIQECRSSLGFAANYCKNSGSKLIFHVASSNHVQPRKIKISKRILFDLWEYKWTVYGIKNSNFVIFQADYQKELFYKYFGIKKSSIIYNIHKPVNKEIVKVNPIKVMWISNIKDVKRPLLFLDIVKRFANNDQIQFIMVGRTDSLDFNEKLIRLTKEINNFKYLGSLENSKINYMLEEAHILINTSSVEGFPNVFIQAWLREVVVVSLEIDPDNILVLNKIGYKSGNIEQMIKDIDYLSKNPNIRNLFGRKSREFAEKRFNWDVNLNNFVDVFRSLENS